LTKYESYLKNNYNSTGIEEGKQLVKFFIENDFSSTDSFVPLFVKCFNFLHKNAPINYELIENNEFENSTFVIFRLEQ